MSTLENRRPKLAGPTTHSAPDVTIRQQWFLLGATTWMIVGLQVDAWAHATTPELETFWTPWHALMYSGIAATGLVLVKILQPLLPELLRGLTNYRSLISVVMGVPWALRTTMIGMALLLVGGGIDTLWHNVFGIEQSLEIFLSPSHWVLITGMVLVASGPTLMQWATPQIPHEKPTRLGGQQTALVMSSMALVLLVMHLFATQGLSLGSSGLGTGVDVMPLFGEDAAVVEAMKSTTVLMMVPLVMLSRRWVLPVGSGVVLVGIPAAVMGVVLLGMTDTWFPTTIVIACLAIEALARWIAPRLSEWSPDARWVLLGACAPIALWGSVLGAGALAANRGWGTGDYGWNVHVTTGILLVTALFGGVSTLIARRVRLGTLP
jgi:hypothetical protein